MSHYYPKTELCVSCSSRELRAAYLEAKAASAGKTGKATMAELELLADPLQRTAFEHKLGIGEQQIFEAIQHESNAWTRTLKFGFGLFAFFLLLCGENVVRFYGYMFAPEFQERREIEFGDFELEDGMGRVYRSDHIFVSRFSSTNRSWQVAMDYDLILVLPTIALFAFLATWGSKAFNRLVSKRIARVRSLGEDDTMERRLWTALATIVVVASWILLFLFGYNRVVPVAT